MDVDFSGIHFANATDTGIISGTGNDQLSGVVRLSVDVQRLFACHIDHFRASHGDAVAEDEVHGAIDDDGVAKVVVLLEHHRLVLDVHVAIGSNKGAQSVAVDEAAADGFLFGSHHGADALARNGVVNVLDALSGEREAGTDVFQIYF